MGSSGGSALSDMNGVSKIRYTTGNLVEGLEDLNNNQYLRVSLPSSVDYWSDEEFAKLKGHCVEVIKETGEVVYSTVRSISTTQAHNDDYSAYVEVKQLDIYEQDGSLDTITIYNHIHGYKMNDVVESGYMVTHASRQGVRSIRFYVIEDTFDETIFNKQSKPTVGSFMHYNGSDVEWANPFVGEKTMELFNIPHRIIDENTAFFQNDFIRDIEELISFIDRYPKETYIYHTSTYDDWYYMTYDINDNGNYEIYGYYGEWETPYRIIFHENAEGTTVEAGFTLRTIDEPFSDFVSISIPIETPMNAYLFGYSPKPYSVLMSTDGTTASMTPVFNVGRDFDLLDYTYDRGFCSEEIAENLTEFCQLNGKQMKIVYDDGTETTHDIFLYNRLYNSEVIWYIYIEFENGDFLDVFYQAYATGGSLGYGFTVSGIPSNAVSIMVYGSDSKMKASLLGTNSAPNRILSVGEDGNANWIDVELSSGDSSTGMGSEDILDIFMGMDLIQPVADENNVVFTDENGKIFIL